MAPERRREAAPGFRRDIQGLRALAVGLVLLYHAGVPLIDGGYIGVDVFFVISGFLITGHLIRIIERDGRVRLGDFYARRARRILPASLVVAMLTVIAVVLTAPVMEAPRVLRDAIATVLYVPNVSFAMQSTDYLADHAASPFQHYWSLGVEEQFYLLWPLLLWGLVVAVRRRRVATIVLVLAIAALSFVAGATVTWINQPAAFFLLPTRAWELLAGGVVALLAHNGLLGRMPRGAAAMLGWAGLAAVLAGAVAFDDDTAFPGVAALAPVLGTAAAIAAGTAHPQGRASRLLGVAPARYLGRISYSLYLVHWPLLIVPQMAVGFDRTLPLLAMIGLGIGLAIPAAIALHHLVEEPFRAPAVLTTRRPSATLWATLAVTVLVVSGVGGVTAWADKREVPTGAAAAPLPSEPVSPPSATEVVPSNLDPALDEVSASVPELYADGCHHDVATETVQDCVYGPAESGSRIAVFGDSHAAQWFPAIREIAAQRGDTSVSAYTKSSCPAVSVSVLDKDVPYSSCDRWRAAVLEELTASRPDLVVISSYAHYDLEGVASGDRSEAWAEGVAETVRLLRASGIAVLVIADTPRFEAAPATCLAIRPGDARACAGKPEQVFDSAIAEAETRAAVGAGAHTVDLRRFLCDEERCPVIIDDLMVYRDVNHLTIRAVGYLTPALRPAVEAALAWRDA